MSIITRLANGKYWSDLSALLLGPSNYCNLLGDFTTTVVDGTKTITLGAITAELAAVLATKHFASAVITRRNTVTGLVDTLPSSNVSYAAPTLTVGDMSGTLTLATDEITISVPGPLKPTRISDGTNPVSVATTIADAQAFIANRLRVSAALMASNGVTLDAIKSFIATEMTSLVGMLPIINGGVFKAVHTALTEGQWGAAAMNSLHMLVVIRTMAKPVVDSGLSWTWYENWGAAAAANVKASPGHVYALVMENTTGFVRYAQLFNTTAAPTTGVTTPLAGFVWTLQPYETIAIGGDEFGADGKSFPVGISFACSSTRNVYTVVTITDHNTRIAYV
jgi:hypothetical protein